VAISYCLAFKTKAEKRGITRNDPNSAVMHCQKMELVLGTRSMRVRSDAGGNTGKLLTFPRELENKTDSSIATNFQATT
jgi:hypothetical protein